MKHQEQGNIFYFFTKENGNINSQMTKIENLKTQKFSPAELWLAQFLGNQYSKIFYAFSQRQNTITCAQKNFADWACTLHNLFT